MTYSLVRKCEQDPWTVSHLTFFFQVSTPDEFKSRDRQAVIHSDDDDLVMGIGLSGVQFGL